MTIKVGAKGRRNQNINRLLKEKAAEVNLPARCEAAYLKWEGCTPTSFLTWAHSTRRWKWGNDPRLPFECGLLCQNCHAVADRKGEDGNRQIILEIENRRGFSFADLILGEI